MDVYFVCTYTKKLVQSRLVPIFFVYFCAHLGALVGGVHIFFSMKQIYFMFEQLMETSNVIANHISGV